MEESISIFKNGALDSSNFRSKKEKNENKKEWIRQYQADQNLHYRIPGEERQKEAENLFDEIIAENFPGVQKETDIYIQKAQSYKLEESKTATPIEE